MQHAFLHTDLLFCNSVNALFVSWLLLLLLVCFSAFFLSKLIDCFYASIFTSYHISLMLKSIFGGYRMQNDWKCVLAVLYVFCGSELCNPKRYFSDLWPLQQLTGVHKPIFHCFWISISLHSRLVETSFPSIFRCDVSCTDSPFFLLTAVELIVNNQPFSVPAIYTSESHFDFGCFFSSISLLW